MDPGGGPGWKLYAEAVRMWVPIVVSLCAISLTVFQAMSTRRHTRLSVEPRVDWRLAVEDGLVSLKLVNVGFGPAVVSDIHLHHAGEAIGETGFAACERVDALLGRVGDDWDTACFVMDDDHVLRPGDEVLLYASRPAPAATPEDSERPAGLEDIWVTARYCSFYEDCWWVDDRSGPRAAS